MNQRFLAVGHTYYGIGNSRGDAIDNIRREGFKGKAKLFRFESDLPFAPRHRICKNNEADFWVTNSGVITWIRCRRIEL